ncbi:MAG: hypothetical protein ACI8TP_004953 [Acidimicrobiales bacterium]|jgi:hypothetical protein
MKSLADLLVDVRSWLGLEDAYRNGRPLDQLPANTDRDAHIHRPAIGIG